LWLTNILHCAVFIAIGVSDIAVDKQPESQTLWTIVYCLAGTSPFRVGQRMRMNDSGILENSASETANIYCFIILQSPKFS
jgi:hypothetical protein